MLDPKEYATKLLQTHYTLGLSVFMTIEDAKEHCLIDVQNTIDALERLKDKFLVGGIFAEKCQPEIEYYNQVKEHIKQL